MNSSRSLCTVAVVSVYARPTALAHICMMAGWGLSGSKRLVVGLGSGRRTCVWHLTGDYVKFSA